MDRRGIRPVTTLVRRLSSFAAAFALVMAIAAPMFNACEWSPSAVGATVNDATGHSSHGGATDADTTCSRPGDPPRSGHGNDCLTLCAMQSGCSTAGFVAESAFNTWLVRSSPPLTAVTLAPPTRALAPDRPPPRV